MISWGQVQMLALLLALARPVLLDLRQTTPTATTARSTAAVAAQLQLDPHLKPRHIPPPLHKHTPNVVMAVAVVALAVAVAAAVAELQQLEKRVVVVLQIR